MAHYLKPCRYALVSSSACGAGDFSAIGWGEHREPQHVGAWTTKNLLPHAKAAALTPQYLDTSYHAGTTSPPSFPLRHPIIDHLPRVFISYAHESESHSAWVLALAHRLRQDGVDAIIDRYFTGLEKGWRPWMSEPIEQADWVSAGEKESTFITSRCFRRRAQPCLQPPDRRSTAAGKTCSDP